MESPPGGPPDTAAPKIVAVQPESGSVTLRLGGDAVIRFDEVIDEMGGAGGSAAPTGLAALVLLSPVTGVVGVEWHRTAIHVKPKEGWKPGRVYRLEVLPGILDLRRNRLSEGRTMIFSTGPAIPTGAVTGTALLWTEQRPLGRALILAAPLPDTVPYIALADSTGAFRLGGIPTGDYVVYAVQDQNNNRQRDPRESFDSARVRVDSTADLMLWTFAHDTAPPRVRSADPVDSVTFRVTFSQHLDPGRRVNQSHVLVFALPDTTPVRVTAVLMPQAYDSLRARERPAADSAGRDRAPAEAVRPPRAGPPAPTPPDTTAAAAARARASRLLAGRPVPVDRLIIRTADPLRAGARYLVRVRGISSLSGVTGGGQQVLAIPETARADTARAR